jgi:hypothetical protein
LFVLGLFVAGLRRLSFGVRAFPHLKIEMWGTRHSAPSKGTAAEAEARDFIGDLRHD